MTAEASEAELLWATQRLVTATWVLAVVTLVLVATIVLARATMKEKATHEHAQEVSRQER
jgi:hypothetical protein